MRTKLKQFRVGTKLTQAEFAEKIGCVQLPDKKKTKQVETA